jgi:nitrogen fixation protein FixH
MSNTPSISLDHKKRELTGRGVLLWLVGFFFVVFAVNGVMFRFATSTFGGVETGNAYNAGLAYRNDIEAAGAQEALHWQVDGKVIRTPSGEIMLDVAVHDSNGEAVFAWTVTARLAHPANSRLDRIFEITPLNTERVMGTARADSGQWDLILDFSRDGKRVYRSRSRITLR